MSGPEANRILVRQYRKTYDHIKDRLKQPGEKKEKRRRHYEMIQKMKMIKKNIKKKKRGHDITSIFKKKTDEKLSRNKRKASMERLYGKERMEQATKAKSFEDQVDHAYPTY